MGKAVQSAQHWFGVMALALLLTLTSQQVKAGKPLVPIIHVWDGFWRLYGHSCSLRELEVDA